MVGLTDDSGFFRIIRLLPTPCHSCQKPANVQHSIQMSRRQSILETLLIFAVFCLHGGWPVPEVNEPYYLGKAIHFWNPQWASADWFLHTADSPVVFYFTVGWLALFLKPTAFAWTLRLLTWFLLAWSWQRLSRAVVPQAWMSVLSATLFVFLLQHYNMAGEWVVGGAEAKGFAFVAVFLALEAMVEGYWNRMWLLLGVGAAFHILVGGWAAVAAGAVWMLANWNRAADGPQQSRLSSFILRPSSWIAPLVAFLLALVGLVPAVLLNHGVDPATAKDAAEIYVFQRFPHHLNPAKFWDDGFVPPFLLTVGLWLLLGRTVVGNPGARRLWGFTAAAAVIGLIGVTISIMRYHDPKMAAGWMRFYWYRLVDVAVPLAVALLSVRWFSERKMRAAMAAVVAVSALHVADCVVLKLFSAPPFADRQIDGEAWRSACLWVAGRGEGPQFTRQPRADKLRNYSQWLDVCRWASDPVHTPPNARFLIPRLAGTFKWYAERGEVVNWKERRRTPPA